MMECSTMHSTNKWRGRYVCIPRVSKGKNFTLYRLQGHMEGVIECSERPKILKQRKNAWRNLFKKYSNLLDDHKTNINMNSELTNSEKLENMDKTDTHDDDYYYTCLPMCKDRSSIQHWLDTSNSPYQVENENNLKTDSSISEDENSKSTLIILNQQSSPTKKQNSAVSLCSSVDTVAYILSNTNVTNKSKTVEIVEGAKNLSLPPAAHAIDSSVRSKLLENSSKHCTAMYKIVKNYDDINILNRTLNKQRKLELTNITSTEELASNDKRDIKSKNISDNEKEIIEKNSNSLPMNQAANSRTKIIPDGSPTVAYVDNIVNPTATKDPDSDDAVYDLCLFEKTASNSMRPNLHFRKKLYTARSSPEDITVELINKRRSLAVNNLHPAFHTPKLQRTRLFAGRRKNQFQNRQKKRQLSTSNSINNCENKKTNNNEDRITSNYEEQDEVGISPLTECHEKSPQPVRKSSTGIKNSSIKNNEKNQNEKLKELMALCSLKNVVIRLERHVDPKISLDNNLKNMSTEKQFTKSLQASNNNSISNIPPDDDSKVVHSKNKNTLQRKEINTENRSSTSVSNESSNASNDSLHKLVLNPQKKFESSMMSISSDEEDYFSKLLRPKSILKKKENNINACSKNNYSNNVTENRKNVFNDRTDLTTNNSDIPAKIQSTINMSIIDSNDENISRQKLETNPKNENFNQTRKSIYNLSTKSRTSLQFKEKSEEPKTRCLLKSVVIGSERYLESKICSDNSLKNASTNKQLTQSQQSSSNRSINHIPRDEDELHVRYSKNTSPNKNNIKIKKVDSIEMQNRKTSNINQKEINTENQTSNNISSESSNESDDILNKLALSQQKQYEKSIINTSSDDEEYFSRLFRPNSVYEKKENNPNVRSKNNNSSNNIAKNDKNLINHLTDSTTNNFDIPVVTQPTNISRIESDNEDIINSRNFSANLKNTNINQSKKSPNKLSMKSRSSLQFKKESQEPKTRCLLKNVVIGSESYVEPKIFSDNSLKKASVHKQLTQLQQSPSNNSNSNIPRIKMELQGSQDRNKIISRKRNYDRADLSVTRAYEDYANSSYEDNTVTHPKKFKFVDNVKSNSKVFLNKHSNVSRVYNGLGKKLSLTDSNTGKNLIKMTRRTILPSVLDESSSEESLIFESFDQRQGMNKQSIKSMICNTYSDDSNYS